MHSQVSTPTQLLRFKRPCAASALPVLVRGETIVEALLVVHPQCEVQRVDPDGGIASRIGSCGLGSGKGKGDCRRWGCRLRVCQ